MKVIERYILRRTFLLFVAALTWTLAIVWTTQVLTRINLVTDSGQSALAFFQIATLILPSIIPIVVPFAVVIGVSQTLTVMNADSELVVVAAAGSSRMNIISPVMLLAFAASAFAFFVHNAVDPYSRQQARELIAAARADLLSIIIQEGSFRKIEDGLFIQVGERLPDSRLGGIFVADSRAPGVDLVYYAKNGAVVERGNKNILVMNDGEIHRKLPAGDVSIIHFQSYAFDLSVFAAAGGSPQMFPKDQPLTYLFNPDPNDLLLKTQPQLFRAEIHKRFTDWLYPMVFALIGLAVSGDARSHREARVNPLVTAVTICMWLRWLGFFAGNQNQSVEAFWPAVYGVPLGAAAIAIWFIRTNRSMELPVSAAEKLISLLRRIADRMMFMRFWRARNAASGESV